MVRIKEKKRVTIKTSRFVKNENKIIVNKMWRMYKIKIRFISINWIIK